MQKQYPEVHSLEESLAILQKYKDDVTKEQYEAIRSNIGNFAIEDMFLNERNIIDNIKIIKGEATANEIITEYKKEWGDILMWDSQENLSEFDKFLIKTNKIGAKSLDELFRKERDITNAKALQYFKNIKMM